MISDNSSQSPFRAWRSALGVTTALVLCVLIFGPIPMPVASSYGLALMLIAIAEVGGRTFRVPGWLVLPLGLAGIATIAIGDMSLLLPHILAGLIAGAVVLALSEFWSRALHRDALGMGEVKLIAAGALWTGYATGWAILAAAALALAFLLVRVARGISDWDEPIPFAPFIAMGVWFAWVSAAPLG